MNFINYFINIFFNFINLLFLIYYVNLIAANKRNIIVHYYNDFTGTYTRRNSAKGDVIFPLKLKNFNGAKIRSCVENREPNEKYEKFDKNILKTLEKSMDFKVSRYNLVSCFTKDFNNTRGILPPICEKFGHMLFELFTYCSHYKVIDCHTLINHFNEESICHFAYMVYEPNHIKITQQNLKSTVLFHISNMYVTLKPKKRIENYLIRNSFYQGILILFLLLLIWILLWIFKFDNNFWKFWNLCSRQNCLNINSFRFLDTFHSNAINSDNCSSSS